MTDPIVVPFGPGSVTVPVPVIVEIPSGPPGPPGPPGAGVTPVVFSQPTPAATWTITHGGVHRPPVVTVDTTDVEIVGDLAYLDDVTVRVTFGEPVAGKAYLLT